MISTRRQQQLVSRFGVPGPTLNYERHLWQKGVLNVAGVDEAGRGAWAGPLVAAAAMLPANEHACNLISTFLAEAGVSIHDSKQLTHPERELVLELARSFGAHLEVVELPAYAVDEYGLGNANRIALCQAIEQLDEPLEHVLIDYFRLPNLSIEATSITKGDQKSVSIALASIAAKVYRDRIMIAIGRQRPEYSFEQHKGYGTQKHADALDRHGITDQHRLCFSPVQRAHSGE